MKINNNFRINNPVLHYKLDPGEPGLATPTHASQSIAKVATHEGTNIRRFKREALEKGGVVIYSNIHLNLEYKGSFIAATSGKSNALIIIPDKKNEKDYNVLIEEDKNNFLLDNKNNKPELSTERSDKKDKDEKKTTSSGINNDDEIEQINDTIERLEIEKLSIEGVGGDRAFGNKNVSEKEQDAYKENRLDEIDKRIQYLEQKKELEKQKQFLSNIMDSKNISFKLVGLIYNNLNQDINGILTDMLV